MSRMMKDLIVSVGMVVLLSIVGVALGMYNYTGYHLIMGLIVGRYRDNLIDIFFNEDDEI